MSLSYDLIAEAYDELYGEEQEAKHREAVRAAPPGQGPVLDAGCGTGLLAKLIDAYYVGLDKSLPMLKKAREKVRNRLADLVCADAQKMPFRPQAFTTIYSITVVHEAPNLTREALTTLKEGGHLAITLLKKRREMLPHILRQLPNPKVIDEDLKDLIIIGRKA
ncbi:class I SAM-dependent methyltransferase [archaeon]|nr:class I SAM-dependent methyltransferase [archaeon]